MPADDLFDLRALGSWSDMSLQCGLGPVLKSILRDLNKRRDVVTNPRKGLSERCYILSRYVGAGVLKMGHS
jgi:hypothetical protein